MRKAFCMCTIWPAFLGAAVLEMLVFALVDPAELHLPMLSHHPSVMVVYTASFFVFWIGTLVASVLTAVLAERAESVDARLQATDRQKD